MTAFSRRLIYHAAMYRDWLAILIGVACLALVLLLASRTVRRILATAWVGFKALGAAVVVRSRGNRSPGPVVVRRAFEELGPTYIKLGQLVASSQGLFPERYCLEFRKCLDRVRPFPFEDVERTLRAELGRDPDEIFASIDPQPLASASIAQVHAAQLRDGQDVVIKVQRPRIGAGRRGRPARPADRWPALMALLAARRAGEPASASSRTSRRTSARSSTSGARPRTWPSSTASWSSTGRRRWSAPRPVDELTTQRVLVMERFFGHRVDDVEKLRASNVDGEEQLLVGHARLVPVHDPPRLLPRRRARRQPHGARRRAHRLPRLRHRRPLRARAARAGHRLPDGVRDRRLSTSSPRSCSRWARSARARRHGRAREGSRRRLRADARRDDRGHQVRRRHPGDHAHGGSTRACACRATSCWWSSRCSTSTATRSCSRPNLNVFRDPRIVAALASDMMQARMQAA